MLKIVIGILIGYLFGIIQTGKILGKFKGFDLSKEGSGNIGATNALRTHGKKIGAITLVGDCLKAVIPMLIFSQILCINSESDYIPLLSLYIGIGAILGHAFPVLPNEKGGKGVSTALGVVLASNPLMTIIPLLCFIIISAKTRLVSLGSIIAVILVAIESIIFAITGNLRGSDKYYTQCIILYFILAIVVIFKHRENIKRLINHNENRI